MIIDLPVFNCPPRQDALGGVPLIISAAPFAQAHNVIHGLASCCNWQLVIGKQPIQTFARFAIFIEPPLPAIARFVGLRFFSIRARNGLSAFASTKRKPSQSLKKYSCKSGITRCETPHRSRLCFANFIKYACPMRCSRSLRSVMR